MRSADSEFYVRRGEQTAVFLDNPNIAAGLTAAELDVVEKIVNWNSHEDWLGRITQVYGRSFVLESPSSAELNTRLTHLQVIGVGGSPNAIQNGIIDSSNCYVAPVDPGNHATQLSSILELREFSPDGKLQLSTRPYSPLHGMISAEAAARGANTRLIADKLAQLGLSDMFVTPVLAAEGHLVNKLDNQGQPLMFQVYRVPGAERLPNQVFQEIVRGADGAIEMYLTAAVMLGNFLRILHRQLGMAYMDGHVGNISLLPFSGNGGLDYQLYATDLGSAKHILRQPALIEKYVALDLFMATESATLSYIKLAEWLSNHTDFDSSEENLRRFRVYWICNLINGYTFDQYEPTDGTIQTMANWSGEEWVESLKMM